MHCVWLGACNECFCRNRIASVRPPLHLPPLTKDRLRPVARDTWPMRPASPAMVEGMRRSVTSVFSQADDLQAATRAEGNLGFVITRRGRFQARLTQVVLHRLRLADVEESLPRIAFISVPENTILIALSVGSRSPQVWGGISTQVDDLITLGPGQCVPSRTDGPSHWGAIWFPQEFFAECSRALTGDLWRLPDHVSVWRPAPSARQELRRLHSVAVRATHAQPVRLTEVEAAHGLEQQLIHALIECLSGGPVSTEPVTTRRHQDLAVRFEEFLRTQPDRELDLVEICAALGVSDRLLRRCCEQQLGMSPMSYVRLRRMQLVHHDLRYGTPDTMRVSDVARRYGFRNLGRFAGSYRELFGELPSLTLRQSPYGAKAEVASWRRTAAAPRPR